jgi:hypothetical protein
MRQLNKKRPSMISALAVMICMTTAFVLCFTAADKADAASKKFKLIYKTDQYAAVKIDGKKAKSGKKYKVGTVITIKSAKGYTINSFMVNKRKTIVYRTEKK